MRTNASESEAQGEFERALSAALVSGVLVEETHGVIRFESALLRDALLERAAAGERSAERERDAAEAKQAHHADDLDPYAFDIARHYERSGMVDEALRFYLRAGRYGQASLRPTAALDGWRAAQAMADAGANAGDEARIEALLGQAEAHLSFASYDEAERAALLRDATLEGVPVDPGRDDAVGRVLQRGGVGHLVAGLVLGAAAVALEHGLDRRAGRLDRLDVDEAVPVRHEDHGPVLPGRGVLA